jgi:hypothetical protein
MAQHFRRWHVRAFTVPALGLCLLLVAAALVAPTTVDAAGTTTLQQYRAWMVEAKAMYPYPQSVDKMYRVMICESSGNPRAVGAGGLYYGLFQYYTPTWRGSWNPYRNQSIYDAKAQIFATAKAWSIGMQRHWGCYFYTPGR